MRHTISHTAEKHLAAWLEALADGSLQLWGLPRSVAAFYYAGFAEGRASRQEELERAERTADYWWAVANIPEDQRKAAMLELLNARLQNATADQWDQFEQVLKGVAGVNPAQTDSFGNGETPSIGGKTDGDTHGDSRRQAA